MIGSFFGLSVLTHLYIIGWNKVMTFLFPRRVKIDFREHILLSRTVSVSIGLLLSLSVMWSGATILHASIDSDSSSYHIAERTLPGASVYAQEAVAYADMAFGIVVAGLILIVLQHEILATFMLVIVAFTLLVSLVSSNELLSAAFAYVPRRKPRSALSFAGDDIDPIPIVEYESFHS